MINMIYCQSRDGFIGKDNKLLYNIPADMKRFKDLTTGGVVVMGHNTWKSLPWKHRPLPNRVNVVLSRDRTLQLPGAVVYHSLKEALAAHADQEVWLIGGESIYEEGLQYARYIFQTHVDQDAEGDARAPVIDLTRWRLDDSVQCKYENLFYEMNVYQRK